MITVRASPVLRIKISASEDADSVCWPLPVRDAEFEVLLERRLLLKLINRRYSGGDSETRRERPDQEMHTGDASAHMASLKQTLLMRQSTGCVYAKGILNLLRRCVCVCFVGT